MSNNENKEQSAKEARKVVLKKYAIPVVLLYILIFPVMAFGILNDVQFIFYIYCCLVLLFVSFVLRKMLIAGGGDGKYKLWWLPAVILAVILLWMTCPGLRLSMDTEYERAEKTFDSWVNTDPNTWTDAQSDYFNNVMNYNGT